MAPLLLADEAAPVTLTPQAFKDGEVTGSSQRVGWTRYSKDGKLLDSFAYRINPQGITRVEAARNQLFATKGGFYVDQFGPGASPISLRQLVASGAESTGDAFYTQREDVLRWFTAIYDPATRAGSTDVVYFHDNHLQQGHRERVYFPGEAVTVMRSVEQHNVWLVEVQMVGLEQHPLGDVVVAPTHTPSAKVKTFKYKVKAGDTLARIVSARIVHNPTAANRKALYAFIRKHNDWLTHNRTVFLDGSLHPHKAMVVYPGEVLVLPRS